MTDPFVARLQKRLEALAQQSPEVRQAAAVQAAVLPLLRVARQQQPAPELDDEAARRSLAAGRPVLAGQDLAFDAGAAAQLFRSQVRAIENLRGHPSIRAVKETRRAVERERLDLPALWQALAAGDADRLRALAAGAGLDVHWLRLLGENSLKPALRALQAAVSQAGDLADWQQGPCPICGSAPLLAEVQGKEGSRRLRCGLCAASWPYPRLKCAFCAATHPMQLGTLSIQGEAEKYRAQTCDACRGYVKVVVTFDPIPDDLLAVEDLATLHLDQLAVERGYSRAPVTA
jgi:FdhE protein